MDFINHDINFQVSNKNVWFRKTEASYLEKLSSTKKTQMADNIRNCNTCGIFIVPNINKVPRGPSIETRSILSAFLAYIHQYN